MNDPTRAGGGEILSRRLTILNAKGLHARASAKFASLAEGFDAEIVVSKDDIEVSGTSIMDLLLLAAAQGSIIDIAIQGPEAPAAMDALASLVERGFDEMDEAT